MDLCDEDCYPYSKNFKAVLDIRQWDHKQRGGTTINIMTATLELQWMTVPSFSSLTGEGAVTGHRGWGSEELCHKCNFCLGSGVARTTVAMANLGRLAGEGVALLPFF